MSDINQLHIRPALLMGITGMCLVSGISFLLAPEIVAELALSGFATFTLAGLLLSSKED